MSASPPSSPTPVPPALSKSVEQAPLAACWSHIGVYGSATCPELAQHVHCRNCPVYASAGVLTLNRALPEGYREEWTRHFALERKRREPVNTSRVIFRVGPEWLALPTQAFQEVAERRPIHSLPHRRRDVVLGLANVRGELLVCVSLEGLLGLARAGQLRDRYHRLLVVSWEGRRFGFPVDEVHGPQRFYPRDLDPAPGTLTHTHSHLTQGMFSWQHQAVGLLDEGALFATLNQALS